MSEFNEKDAERAAYRVLAKSLPIFIILIVVIATSVALLIVEG